MNRSMFIATVSTLALLSAAAKAAEVYDNLRLVIIPQHETAPSASDRRFAQQFLMGENDRVDDVVIRLTRVGMPSGSMTVELWDASESGWPASKLGDVGSIPDIALIETTATELTFENTVGDLMPSEEYWVVLNFGNSSVAIDNSIAWAGFSTDVGTQGAAGALVSIDSGDSWFDAPVAYFAMRVIASLTGDFSGNGTLDADDIDELTRQSASLLHMASYDLNEDSFVDTVDIDTWIKGLFHSWIGDVDLNGEFNSSDLIAALAAGTYEIDADAVWSTGDFDGSGRFDSSDLVRALADGGYEQGTRPSVHAVPEPSGIVPLCFACVALAIARGDCRRA